MNLGDTVGSYIFQLQIQVDAQGGTFESSAHSVADYFGTLTFPLSGPIFSLPAGFTVEAPDGGIFNNLFVGDGSAPKIVPEPATLLLLGSTFAGVDLASWRKRQRRG